MRQKNENKGKIGKIEGRNQRKTEVNKIIRWKDEVLVKINLSIKENH